MDVLSYWQQRDASLRRCKSGRMQIRLLPRVANMQPLNFANVHRAYQHSFLMREFDQHVIHAALPFRQGNHGIADISTFEEPAVKSAIEVQPLPVRTAWRRHAQ